MDKDFLDSCKILQKCYTRIIAEDNDTNNQASSSNYNNEVINRAREILSEEQTNNLTTAELENIRQNSVVKYARELDKYMNPKKSYRNSLCQSNNIKWDEDIWNTPNPKRKSIYTNIDNKQSDTNFDKANEIVKVLAQENINTREIENGKQKEMDNQEMQLMKCEEIVKYDEIIDTGNEDKLVGEEQSLEIKEKEMEALADMERQFQKLYITSKLMPKETKFLEVKKIIIEKYEESLDQSSSESGNPEEVRSDESETLQENKQMKVALKKYFNNENKLKQIVKEEKHENLTKKGIKFLEIGYKEKRDENIKSKIDVFLENVEKYQSNSKSTTNISADEKPITRKTKSFISFVSSSNVINDLKTFQHRYQAQKEIIDIQKQKLILQNKLIEDLKLKKIQEETDNSLENCTKLYQETASASKKFKYKAKLIKEDTQDVNKEPEGLSLILKLSKAPKIVQCMEKRAKDREERRLLTKERRRLIEEEKKKLAEELIQKKKHEELEEKNKRMQALMEQHALARQLELQKKIEKKKDLELQKKAFLHYRKKLLDFSFAAFKDCVEQRKLREEIAVKFNEFNTSLRLFRSWRDFTLHLAKKKRDKAEQCYNHNLLMRHMVEWHQLHLESVRKKQVAQDFYDMKLQSKFFSSLHQLICIYHIEYRENLAKATQHYNRQLLFQYFGRWQTLPEIMKIERKKDERRKKWRQKVAEILPDYNPDRED